MKFLKILSIIFLFSSYNAGADPEINSSEIETHIKYLASDALAGRKPGTPGGLAAAEYIKSQFVKYGLKPLAEDYFHKFQIINDVEAGKNNKLIFDNIEYKINEDYTPLSFSGIDSADAEVIFAGYGISINSDNLMWDDYSDIDVTDKWVMILRGDPDNNKAKSRFKEFKLDRIKVIEAQDHKAAGVIIVSPEIYEEKDVLMPMLYDKVSSGSRIPVINITRALADKILAKSETNIKMLTDSINSKDKPVTVASESNIFINSEVVQKTVSANNVAGIIEGTDPELKNDIILIGGHFDHLGMGGSGSGSRKPDTSAIHNGADDNASGIAGILEIAEYFSVYKPKRSLAVVAFDAEETGILGSSKFVSDSVINPAIIKAMINLDMIGRLDKNIPSIMVGGTGTSKESEAICEEFKSDLEPKYSPAGLGPSDHASFYASDIPVFFISTGAHEDYHTPEDDFDKINFKGTQTVTSFAKNIAYNLLNRDENLLFSEAGPKVRSTAKKFKVTLGIMPDFAGKAKDGLSVSAVSKGRPAEAAGMLKGDKITAIDGMPVSDIYEYMARLKKLKAGQQITVDVMRKGQKVVLIVHL